MATEFSDAELLAYLDEGLPVERMTAIESALRTSDALRMRTATLRDHREQQGHSVGDIWRQGRLSCPTRHQLGSYLLGALAAEHAQYIAFHLQTVGCRYCAANLADLQQADAGNAAETSQRRQKFFQSSAGYVRGPGQRD